MKKKTKEIVWYCSICDKPCTEDNCGSGMTVVGEIGDGYCFDCEKELAEKIVGTGTNLNGDKVSEGNKGMAQTLIKLYKEEGYYG